MKLKYLGIAIVVLWFGIGGVAHFTSSEFFVSIVPPYVPYPLAMVYISGVCELLGAIGVLLPRWRALAGKGLIALTLCVTPANVHMWLHPELFPHIDSTLLTLRLFVQGLLIACIWWVTRPARPKAAAHFT